MIHGRRYSGIDLHGAGPLPAPTGFTLVELLVVIGVISILASLLLPVLGRTMDSARDITCRSNLKQVGIAGTMYADENNGILPHRGGEKVATNDDKNVGYYYLSAWGDTKHWDDKIMAMVGQVRQKKGTILHCPTMMKQVSFYPNNSSLPPRNWAHSTYDLSRFMGAVRHRSSGVVEADTPAVPKSTMLTSKVAWVADKFGYMKSSPPYTLQILSSFSPAGTSDHEPPDSPTTCYPGTSNYPWPLKYPQVYQGHGEHQAQYLLGDGHVEALDAEEAKRRSSDKAWTNKQ